MKVLIITSGNGGILQISQEFLENRMREYGYEVILCKADETTAGCTGCGRCWKKKKCVFEDDVNLAAENITECGMIFILGEVIYGRAPKPLLDFMDRLTHCASAEMADTLCAYLPLAARNSCTEAVNRITGYMNDAGMIILAGRQGHRLGSQSADNEKVMDALCRRAHWLLESLDAGKKAGLERPEDTYERKLDYVR
ncbi:MAG: flavodoxin family protein [Solobacterium sp.]|nr:flavodoxin family protein [Solobacterium sp.]